MAYAPHTNTDVHNARRMGVRGPALLLGQFVEREYGNTFEFLERDDRIFPADFHADLPHMISVGDRGWRLANVLKTVAYIQVDEGTANREKWSIKGKRDYDNSWMEA